MALEIFKGIDEFTTRAQIRDIFEEFGEVEICSLPPTDARGRDPGQVYFVQESDARKAVDACMTGRVKLNGNQIRVRLKSDGEQRSPSEQPPPARGQTHTANSKGGSTRREPARVQRGYDGPSRSPVKSRPPSLVSRRRQPAHARPTSESRSFSPQQHSTGRDQSDRRAPLRELRNMGRSDSRTRSPRARSRSRSWKGHPRRRENYDHEPRDRDWDRSKGKGKERRVGDWDCPNCGVLVFASKDECFACGEPRPRGAGAVSRGVDKLKGKGKGKERRYNDWDCPKCGIMVFASKDQCFSCGEPKPDSLWEREDDRRGKGKGKDKGKRHDWDCPACGKLVFAYKDQCFSCGANRPASKNERRRSESRSNSRNEKRTFVGRLCRIHEERGTTGYTFIECNESSKIYGKDIFLHFDSNPDAQPLREGDSIMFNVKISANGRPESINARPVEQSAENRAGRQRSRQRSLQREEDNSRIANNKSGIRPGARSRSPRRNTSRSLKRRPSRDREDGGDAEDTAPVAEFDPYMDDPVDEAAKDESSLSKGKRLLLEVKNFIASPKEKDVAADLVQQLNPTLQMLVAYDPAQGKAVLKAWLPSPECCLMRLQSEALVRCAVPMLHNLALKGKKLQVKAVEEASEAEGDA